MKKYKRDGHKEDYKKGLTPRESLLISTLGQISVKAIDPLTPSKRESPASLPLVIL